MWHKLALSVIPPVRTQHAIVRRPKYVLGNFIFALSKVEYNFLITAASSKHCTCTCFCFGSDILLQHELNVCKTKRDLCVGRNIQRGLLGNRLNVIMN